MKSTKELNIIYKKLQDKFPFKDYIESKEFGSVYETIFKVAEKYLNEGDKILDFGCGPCDKTAFLQMSGYNCVGYDDFGDQWHSYDDNINKINFFAKEVGISLITDETELSNQNKFKMIMLLDVIEHHHNSPRSLLLYLLDKLNEDGILLITVPNAGNIRKRISLLFGYTNYPRFKGYYWSSDPWRGHNREYVYNDLKLLAKYLDLECLLISGRNHMIYKLPFFVHPFYKLITFFFPSWKDSWVLICRKTDIWSPKRDPITEKG